MKISTIRCGFAAALLTSAMALAPTDAALADDECETAGRMSLMLTMISNMCPRYKLTDKGERLKTRIKRNTGAIKDREGAMSSGPNLLIGK